MISRRDDHRAPKAGQGLGQHLGRLTVQLVRVEQVPGQEHQLGPVVVGPVPQAAGQLPALLPPQTGLLLR